MAITVMTATRWRLRKGGLDTMTQFRDVANAFPSMSWNGLDEMIANKVRTVGREVDYCRILRARHREARMRIEARGEESMVMKTGKGDAGRHDNGQRVWGKGITRGWTNT